jgi:hypothetical protein
VADRPIPHNLRSSGALIASNSHNGIAIFTGHDLSFGAVCSGRVTIANVGPVPGSFRLRETDAANHFAPGELKLVIDDISGDHPDSVFIGDIGGLPSAGVDLGRFEPSQPRKFRFLVILGLNTHDSEQRKSASATYEWSVLSAEFA